MNRDYPPFGAQIIYSAPQGNSISLAQGFRLDAKENGFVAVGDNMSLPLLNVPLG